MKITMKLKDPQAVEITATITMTAEQWAAIRDALNDHFCHVRSRIGGVEATSRLARTITDLLGRTQRELMGPEVHNDAKVRP